MKNIMRTITRIAIIVCAFALHPALAQTHKAKKPAAKSRGIMNRMTVSKLAPAGRGSDYTKVLFAGSDQVYRLPAKANPVYYKRLKESMDKHVAVYVKRANEESDIILSVIVAGTPGQKKKKK